MTRLNLGFARERRLCRRSSPPGLHRNAESLEFRATVLLSLRVLLALIPLALGAGGMTHRAGRSNSLATTGSAPFRS